MQFGKSMMITHYSGTLMYANLYGDKNSGRKHRRE